ncbi:MAG: family 20 glycosylhydrolase [bacterium]|nr:family 20 glycosylhydrolase [bacterium]
MTKSTLFVVAMGMASAAFCAKPVVIPDLREWTDGEAVAYTLPATPRIVLDSQCPQLRLHADAFAEDLKQSQVVDASATPIKGDIRLKVVPGILENEEGYILEVSPDAITITAPTPLGAYWGTRTLVQVFQNENGTFPSGKAVDWPQYKVRGFMFDCGRKYFAPATIETLIDLCSYYKLNDLQLHLSDNYIWLHNYPGVKTAQDVLAIEPSAGAFRLESSIEGLTAKEGAFSKKTYQSLVARAAAKGVQIVPELDVPGHALAMVRVRPDLMYKGSVGHKHDCERAAMLDLDNPETFDFVKKIFDEYIDEGIFSGDVIHIGTDEYYGDAESYRAFTDKLLKHIIAKGKTPRFWGSLRAKKGKTPVVVKGTQMHIWSLDWQDPRDAVKDGYEIINILDVHSYVVPNGTGNVGAYGDDLNVRPVYENWTPGTFKRGGWDCSVDPTNPLVLGAAWAVWNDNAFLTDPGLCGRDLLPMIHKNCAVFAQRTWAKENSRTYDAFIEDMKKHAPILGTEKPKAWTSTYFVEVTAEPQLLEGSDELSLYAVSPVDGTVGFVREEAHYSFGVKLDAGKTYEITFASKDRKASVSILPVGAPESEKKTYDVPKRQHYPNACRYYTLPSFEK